VLLQERDGVQHVLQVVRRLAHAHVEHAVDAHRAARVDHLLDDLERREIALQAEQAARTETTADRAADLRRDADGAHRHRDRLDELVVGEADHEARGAVGGGRALDDAGRQSAALPLDERFRLSVR
jgi:hypothetical protein